jgi:nitrous oxidase accessory protein NosD
MREEGTGSARKVRTGLVGLLAGIMVLAALTSLAAGSVAAPLPKCMPAGATGLTAKVVATPGEMITGSIWAKGCNIGIYVGPTASGVTIQNAHVAGASDQGIYVQNAGNVSILESVITLNGEGGHACAPPPRAVEPCITMDKAVQLDGVSGAIIAGNRVAVNFGNGGIGLSDDGTVHPGLLPGAEPPIAPRASVGNVIEGNWLGANTAGCDIVLSAFNAGVGVLHNLVLDNYAFGSVPGTGPDVGGIVVAADAPHTLAWDNKVIGNHIRGGLESGVIIHAEAPGAQAWNNTILGNIMSYNGFQGTPDPTVPTGIDLTKASPLAVLTNTTVVDNSVNHDTIGIWLCGATNTNIQDPDGPDGAIVVVC